MNHGLAPVALAITLAFGAATASATPITYTGALVNGDQYSDTVVQGGNESGPPSAWDFYLFQASAGQQIDIIVRRLAAGLDPVASVWFGVETDVENFTDMFSSSLNLSLIATQDDNLADLLGGPFGDPHVSFTAAQTGIYTLAISSFASDTSDNPFPYCVGYSDDGSANDPGLGANCVPATGGNPVPAPLTAALLALGAALVMRRNA